MLLHSLPKRKLFGTAFPWIKKFVPLDSEPRNSHLPFETNSYVQNLIQKGTEMLTQFVWQGLFIAIPQPSEPLDGTLNLCKTPHS
jgi:hypothetical protein